MISRSASAIALASALLTACSPSNHRFVMRLLRTQFADQYHECVPLGWTPVPVAGTYYPGFSTEYRAAVTWLPPLWVGSVHAADAANPQALAASAVLKHLVRAGMLHASPVPGGRHYFLTMRALPYYFDRSDYGNNPEHYPYLCYSTIVPERVAWTQPVHTEPDGTPPVRREVFRAEFQWRPSAPASWAEDAVLRRHSVILGPAGTSIVAKFVSVGGTWEIENIYAGGAHQPRLVDAAAWPQLHL